MYIWKVVPICERQRRDVRPDDILNGGHFRRYRGGGRHDKFSQICERRLGLAGRSNQFVVQLYGCVNDCPYCYVTHDGVWGDYVVYATHTLMKAYVDSGCNVLHLMGGAPALHLEHWPALLAALNYQSIDYVFTSDFVLTEPPYDMKVLRRISSNRSLFAINVKGLDSDEFRMNTNRKLEIEKMWDNLQRLHDTLLRYYFTFTNVRPGNIRAFWADYKDRFGKEACQMRMEDAFAIDLINYEALKP